MGAFKWRRTVREIYTDCSTSLPPSTGDVPNVSKCCKYKMFEIKEQNSHKLGPIPRHEGVNGVEKGARREAREKKREEECRVL